METIKKSWNPQLYNDKHAFVYGYGEELIQLLKPQAHERILDLGCGSGQLTAKIHESTKKVMGIDHSPEMIADAQSKYPGIVFQIGDAGDFSFAEKFDSIFSNATLHWVLNYKNAIRCMYSNLKSGGKIILEFGGKGNVQSIVDPLRTSLQGRGHSERAGLKLWFFPSIGQYASALEEAGFRVLMAEHFDRPTELSDDQAGIKDWLSMFAGPFFKGLSMKESDSIMEEVQEKVKASCFVNGKWYAHYKRIRIMAIKDSSN